MQGRQGSGSGSRVLRPPERQAIEARLREGARVKEIAAQFGCSTVTVWRIGSHAHLRRRRVDHSQLRLGFEINRTGGRRRYRALAAERAALGRLSRPKPGKLSRSPRLAAAVEAGLQRRWPPQQISARLKIEYPDDPEMRISHETIYQSLYVQSRGELRRQPAANLRRGRTRRRVRGAVEHRGRIADMVPISQRPPGVSDRAVPGHWEGDLLVGKAGRSFIATLVERQTRYVMLARLGSERRSAHVTAALAKLIARLPDHRSQVELDEIAAELNGRPRQTLGWATPAEKMEDLLR